MMPTTLKSEYDELKDAGMTDQGIRMARNSGASHAAILLWAKRLRRAEETVCEHCGVTTTVWSEWRMGKMVTRSRDFYPVSFVIRLKPDTQTTYIVPPEIERLAVRIRSLNAGKLDYAVDLPLPKDGKVSEILTADVRIQEWHTETSAPVCESHVNFVGGRW